MVIGKGRPGAGAMSIAGESVKRINDEYLCAARTETKGKAA